MGRYSWSSFTDLVVTVNFLRRDLAKIQKFATANGKAAGDFVAKVYDFAGAPDALASTKGAEARKVFAELETKLQEADKLLDEFRMCMKNADAALEEAEARRKVAAANLGN